MSDSSSQRDAGASPGAPLPFNEWQRLTALRRYQILDTLPEQAFDDLAWLAAQSCAAPIGAISLVDSNRQWFKARIGIAAQETPRQVSFCAHALLRPDELLIVPDTLADDRFRANDLVTGDPHIRFYAGAPLVMADGMVLGALCVMDTVPRDLTADQQNALAILRRSVVNEIELREALRIANVEMERALRTKDTFLANMSHELRTPLNTILSLGEIMLEGIYDPLTERQQTAIQRIETSSQHLLALINDILDLSKVEAGQLDLHIEPIEVIDICQLSLQFVKELALKKRLQLSYLLSDERAVIEVDAKRLKQMLVNLLSNAVKFTPAGGTVHLEVQVDAEANRIRFAVRDTGIGIAPKDLARLFQPFVQIDSNVTRQQEGTGLGLALVRHLVELHSGTISVESAVGTGSCFTLTLPYRWREAESPGVAHTAPVEASLAGDASPEHTSEPQPILVPISGTILLVDDSEDSLASTLAYLQVKGYQVIVARNGREALDRAEQDHVDVVLLDIQMPELDGLETTRRLRSNPATATTLIIALTALAMPGDRERCLAAGADDYISKPVKLSQLVTRIEQLRRTRMIQ